MSGLTRTLTREARGPSGLRALAPRAERELAPGRKGVRTRPIYPGPPCRSCSGCGREGVEVQRSDANRLLCLDCHSETSGSSGATAIRRSGDSSGPPPRPRKLGADKGSVGHGPLDASPPRTDETERRARALGITGKLGDPFPCILRDHGGHEARLLRAKSGYWKYGCTAQAGSWGLGEVRALLGHGDLRQVSNTSAARWRERLDYEAGLLVPRPVPIVLPSTASAALTKVARGWGLLVGLRDPRWKDDPFTFARQFVMAYCQVTDQQAKTCVRQLEGLGEMCRVGQLPRGRHWAVLWQARHVENDPTPVAAPASRTGCSGAPS